MGRTSWSIGTTPGAPPKVSPDAQKRVFAAPKMALDKTSTTRAAGHQSVTDWGGQMGTYGPSMGVRRGFEGVQTVGRDPVLLLLS